MKPCLSLSVLLAAGLFPAVALLRAADPSPVPPDGKTRLTGRIDALLHPHLKPVPLPVVLPNPFIVVRGTADLAEAHDPAAPGAANPAPPADDSPLLTDAETLARGVARLKIGGTMQVNDATQLIINQEPHKEGDYVILENKGALLYVQISRLTPAELTLRFREATQVIRLKNPAKPKDAEP
jgi:hypothetical protein